MDQTVGAVFEAVARELRGLAELTSSLQGRVSVRSHDAADIEAFQGFDYLNQALEGLASYVGHVGTLVPGERMVAVDQAAEGLRLSALAGRLRGVADSAPGVATAEIELF